MIDQQYILRRPAIGFSGDDSQTDMDQGNKENRRNGKTGIDDND
jgi:hypothetical protein